MKRQQARRTFAAALATAVLLALAPGAASAAEPPAKFWTSCPTGSGAGECVNPRGIGVDPNTPGHLYLADLGNDRIVELTAWGEFVKAWGWGVADGSPQLQSCGPAATPPSAACQAGSKGAAAGQLNNPRGVAVDSGGVYVVDGENHRVQKFDQEGDFELAFGGDVVAFGPSDSANDEQQELVVAATSGSFKLGFANPFPEGGTAQTAALPFNASSSEVETALNALSTIGGVGGSVSVSGGPGDATGTSPYEIAFGANLGGDDVPLISIDRSSLGPAAIGSTLRCSSTSEAETIEFAWLRNGAEIPGAESPTYSTVPADAGKAIQCQVTAKNTGAAEQCDLGPGEGECASIQVANPVYVATPEPATPAPVAPGFVNALRVIDETLDVGGDGGETLTCVKGSWQGASSFAYRWYRNGETIPGATASTYVVTEEDLATPAYFQCAVIASNAGGTATAKLSMTGVGDPNGQAATTFPSPGDPPAPQAKASMAPPSSVFDVNQGGAPEICKASAGDNCKIGVTGTGDGQFGSWPLGSFIAARPGGGVFVGDRGRIQEFDATGEYLGNVPDLSGALTNEAVQSLATDDDGSLYLLLAGEPDAFKLSASGAKQCTAEVARPNALAVAPSGELYVFNRSFGAGIPSEVLAFDSEDCNPIDLDPDGPGLGFADGEFDSSTGMATGAACLSAGHDLYLANADSGSSFIRAFGPPPDDPECPPIPRAPDINAQFAVSVGTEEATLRAQINPHFWSGSIGQTTYYLQYATATCIEAEGWQGACVKAHPAPPGSKLKAGVVDEAVNADVFIAGLEPATRYRYRFVAEAKDPEGEPTVPGQPVFGVGGKPGIDGEEASFKTFAKAGLHTCPNEALRTGPSSALPDCRAYEMVSPVDKANGEIRVDVTNSSDPARLHQSSLSGGKLTYSSYRAFADPVSAPYSSQYLATRGTDGWSSENISPPQEGADFGFVLGLDALYRVFSPELEDGWVMTVTGLQLAPGAQGDSFNLYRRDNQSGDYEACTTGEPQLAPQEQRLQLQGVSADQRVAVFRLNDKLTEDASPVGGGIEQIYACAESGGGPRALRVASVLPNGEPSAKPSSVGTPNSPFSELFGRTTNLSHAISADGSEVFWSTVVSDSSAGGTIYLRLNPDQPQSAQQFGSAAGAGDLIGPATATGKLTPFSKTISNVNVTGGEFVVGQTILGAGIPPETTITDVGVGELKISKAIEPGKGGEGVALTGLASNVITDLSTASGAFAVGQTISGQGIAFGTTVTEVTGSTLTLDTPPTETEADVPLESFSECTEAEKACTVPVSEAVSRAPARFRDAAADGSKALFSIGGTLYEFDVATETAQPIAAGFQGVAGASEDASRIYFASNQALTGEGAGEANGEGDFAVAGKPNLYLYEGGGYEFVATLAVSDLIDLSPVTALPNLHAARVTPDGEHLAFISTEQPTGYDNADVNNGRPAAEVYLYDAGSEELLCASCNPSGARPVGKLVQRTESEEGTWAAAKLPAWTNSLYATRALSDDGNRLFFDSVDSLVLSDTNGKQDVYEWEAPGTGSCKESDPAFVEEAQGCIELISSGKSAEDSEFVDADTTGENVFFTTEASLLPQDPGLVDVYDARVQGGFPPPPEPAPECEGEACQPAPSPPEDPTPASLGFRGAGDVVEGPKAKARRCPKGKRKVRRAGKARCVKRKQGAGKKQRRRAGNKGRAAR